MSRKDQSAVDEGASNGHAATAPAIPEMTLPSPSLRQDAIDAPRARDGARERIKAAVVAARAIRPDRKNMHCLHCWGQGREDTLRAIEADL